MAGDGNSRTNGTSRQLRPRVTACRLKADWDVVKIDSRSEREKSKELPHASIRWRDRERSQSKHLSESVLAGKIQLQKKGLREGVSYSYLRRVFDIFSNPLCLIFVSDVPFFFLMSCFPKQGSVSGIGFFITF